MKAGISGGSRGWWVASAASVAVLVLSIALLLAGCGGGDETAEETSDQPGNARIGNAGGDVLPGYTQEQCIADMTARYGDETTAKQVCDAIRTDYGSLSPGEIEAILPEVEKKLGLSPPLGSQNPAGGSGGNPMSQTPAAGGTPGGSQPPGFPSSSDWGSGGSGGIDIDVPPPPAP